ncbi:MAG: type restriction enzyme protein [Thermoanaerobacterium sp.]|jgi:type I restriction enzyme M protein|nr:type restriction enzyme protein [Anaerophaga sp.]MDN5318012.1 type restriction enzyme protein [Thermoanaerobacterium sp.]
MEDLLKKHFKNQKYKVVLLDLDKESIRYDPQITQHRKINKITGPEEYVRAFLVARLVNELGYKPENIEIEKEYDIGRPKVNKPR